MQSADLFELCCLNAEARELCALYGREPITTQGLADWFAKVDFEALPSEVTCMAAVIGAACQFSGVPEGLISRLRGIIRYVHTLNSGMLAGASMISIALNRAGVDGLLMEQTALYLSCPQAPQRHLWQTGIGVHCRDLARAAEAVREAGFEVERYRRAVHAHQGPTRQTVIYAWEDGAYLWQDAMPWKRGNAQYLCPQTAATFIAVNQSTFRALTKSKPQAAVVRWVMDMKQIIAEMDEEDWKRAVQIARQEHAVSHIRLMLELYLELSGDVTVSRRLELFESGRQNRCLSRLLVKYRGLPERCSRLRRAYLRCRLRRPDSLGQSLLLMSREVARKLA